jgi:hypothetical protein
MDPVSVYLNQTASVQGFDRGSSSRISDSGVLEELLEPAHTDDAVRGIHDQCLKPPLRPRAACRTGTSVSPMLGFCLLIELEDAPQVRLLPLVE